MRPLRFLLSLASCIVAFFLLLFIGPWRSSTQEQVEKKGSIRTYFNWRTPSSLFPPSAVISLTDDNSTIFVARPANFGPLLPSKSLSGELWIGSGFGEDRLGRGGSAEGELGCSDVPGWSDQNYPSSGQSLSDAKSSWSTPQDNKAGHLRRRDLDINDEDVDEVVEEALEDDGTDDHLHHPLPASDGYGELASNAKKQAHADIQSLQESAEIAGKIVLLSRGGCGFAEKVKWAQRRGGIALIVGDDVRGAPLVTMYARGDTSNVTIPSLFVSHTSAHLLSGLIPTGRIGGLRTEEAERLGLALGDKAGSSRGGPFNGANGGKGAYTTTTAAVKSASTPKLELQDPSGLDDSLTDEDDVDTPKSGWLGSIFGRRVRDVDTHDQPTNNGGQVGWVLQQDFDDADDGSFGGLQKQYTTSTTSTLAAKKTPNEPPADGFVIGVQDWRDPDLLAYQKEKHLASSTSSASAVPTSSAKATAPGELKGGSITPGSGEYAKPARGSAGTVGSGKSAQVDTSGSGSSREAPSNGWLGRFFTSDEDTNPDVAYTASKDKLPDTFFHSHGRTNANSRSQTAELREGLWVTLTPTSMSSSPFFDTLLVLVVSPLVTLTVVYALLLLRSRIRRRRWRAPKSVVERLPVRTYQTMPSTTANTSSTTSSISSPITSTTPLLPSNARPINARPRPRSRTTSGVTTQQSSSVRSSDSIASPSPDQIEEKRAAGLSEWRKRYGGKQRECVVCLEEYVDGVSRVMSLPCGHEFHAECITPWLTTRRRTCPICKGDVVRSLARSNGSTSTSTSPQHAQYTEDEDSDDVQEQAATARNDDPAAHQPVTLVREDEVFDEDLESGMGRPDRTR